MLVLTRKLGQRLVIGDDIVVTVLSVHNGQIRLGIEAPRSVPIRREELAPVADKEEMVPAEYAAEWV